VTESDQSSLSKNDSKPADFKVTYYKVLGFPVGSAQPLTRKGYKLLFKYIGFAVLSAAIYEWQPLHDLLNPQLSNIASKLGLVLIGLTIFFFFKMLKKHAYFEKKYLYSPPEWRD